MLEPDWADEGGMSIQPTSVQSSDTLSHLSKSMPQDKMSAAAAKKTPEVQKTHGDAPNPLTKQAADFSAGSKAANGHIDGYA